MKPLKELFKKRDLILAVVLILYILKCHWIYSLIAGICYIIYREKVDKAEEWWKNGKTD